MEFGKAFSFAFEDPDWLKKLGVGALLLIIPFFGWFVVAGWGIEITKRVIQRDPQPLPEWNDFGGFFMKGLQALVISLVYLLPLILVVGCPSILLVALASTDTGGDSGVLGGILAAIPICVSCFSIVYFLLAGFVAPAAIGKFADCGQMGSAFRFGEVFGLVRAAPSAYLFVVLGGIVVGLLGNLIGSVLCIIGALATVIYSTAVNSHLVGQAYNEAAAARGLKTAF